MRLKAERENKKNKEDELQLHQRHADGV